jgi:TnpA family transposase
MSGIGLRFLGVRSLPAKISRFDVETFFSLSKSDVSEIQAQFRSDRQVAAAVQLVFLRATGTTIDRAAVVPKSLLAHLGAALGIRAPTIASLKSIYRREATLYEHQRWAKKHARIEDIDEETKDSLRKALELAAHSAASVDELVHIAAQYLFGRRRLIPGDRALRDSVREVFAAIEREAFKSVESVLPHRGFQDLLGNLYGKRTIGADQSNVDWLKTAAGKHSPSSLKEILQKIALLREWKVDTWDFGPALSFQRQQAFAQAFAGRPPSISRRKIESSLVLEVVSFLRITLLELTDQALYMAGRRTVDLVNRARKRAEVSAEKSTVKLRNCVAQIDQIANDKGLTSRQQIGSIREVLADLREIASSSRAAQIRGELAKDSGRIRSLLHQLGRLPFEGHGKDHGFAQWNKLQELYQGKARELPPNLSHHVRSAWRELVEDADRKRAMKAFEASTLLSMRTSLKRGTAWVPHSHAFRDREDLFIPSSQWEAERARYAELLQQPLEPDAFLEPLLDRLKAGLAALAAAVKNGAVGIRDGEIHIPALQAMDIDKEPVRTRDTIFRAIGDVQLPEILVEMDAATGYSQILLARKATDDRELLAVYGAVLAHGTEMDAKTVAAMTPGVEAPQILTAMRMIELPGRLRKANLAVLDFHARHPIVQLWGDGRKASSDMMSVDASQHLWNSRPDPRRRTLSVGFYTHVDNRHGLIGDMPWVLNERQAGVAIEGVERYNADIVGDRERLIMLAVDTHGYTNFAMSTAKLRHVDLCPRLHSLAERKLCIPRGFGEIPEILEPVIARDVSLRGIRLGYDNLLRATASLTTGHVSPSLLLQKLGSAARGDDLHRAGDHLGRLLRTIFLCDYFTRPEFRREIHTLLNRGESVHLNRPGNPRGSFV